MLIVRSWPECFKRAPVMLRSRRTYEIANGWDGNCPVEGIPVVVLTHNPPVKTPKGKSPLIFGTNGVESAVVKAKALARDKHVGMGGSAVRQALRAGLVEELYLHIA